MIEALSKIVDLAKESGQEVGKGLNAFDKRKEIETGIKETGLITDEDNPKINIDKRLPNGKNKEITKITDVSEKSNLTDSQKKELVKKGFSPGLFDKTTYKDGVYKVKTDNSKMVEQKHPDTKVPYKRKILDVLGKKIEGVFPVFDSKFDAKLPENKIIAKDKVQFSECNAQLKDAIKKNPELKKQFSERQLAQIEQGVTPAGCVWHHNEVRGKMQLVDAKTHLATGHTGGKAIWGGGKDAR